MQQITLSPNEQAELNALDDTIIAALKTRKDWLDTKMKEHSPLRIGDTIYNLKTGHPLGRITQLFRISDLHLSYEYKYEISPGYFDSTSNHSKNLLVGTKEDAIEYAKARKEPTSNDKTSHDFADQSTLPNQP